MAFMDGVFVWHQNLLVGVGNPLLDMSAVVSKEFLAKYGLKENDAILADKNHMSLYTDLVHEYQVTYTAGGSVQNTLRVAQWLIGEPFVTTYFGCVGMDKYSRILFEKATDDGVNVRYQQCDKGEPTGTCAVLITDHNRSLCANLGCANNFTIDHIRTRDNKYLIDSAKYYYISGFFLTVNPPTQMEIAKIASENDRVFMMNLSAPFICQHYTSALMQAMPYIDILFGNESEAEAFAESQNFNTKDILEIAFKICKLPKQNKNKPRIVIFTQGVKPVIVAREEKIEVYPVKKLPKEKIVDTNGAGDAFVGGFLSQYIQELNLETCVKCGMWAASQIIQRSGCTFEGKPSFIYTNY
ncbi:adenosine kinase 2 [Leptinotarsa decemlineata]|uniref:adenosine kinase 2 n=1 Tax=Leptinotarsa decemlineata TaxID=7539 RepID=UPI003D30A485